MKVITPGHRYEVANFEDPNSAGNPNQIIQFIEKTPIEVGTNELRTICDGTTNEELLLVLIDRLRYLGAKLPARENSIAITKLEEALMWLEKRTRDRKARNVEGTHAAKPQMDQTSRL